MSPVFGDILFLQSTKHISAKFIFLVDDNRSFFKRLFLL